MIVNMLRATDGKGGFRMIERFTAETPADIRWLDEQVRLGRLDGGDGKFDLDPGDGSKAAAVPKMHSNPRRRGMGVYWAKTVKRIHVPLADRYRAALRHLLATLGEACVEHVRSGHHEPFPLARWQERARQALGPLYGRFMEEAARDLVATTKSRMVKAATARVLELDEDDLIETMEARPDMFIQTIWERLNANLEEMVENERTADERADTIEERFAATLDPEARGVSITSIDNIAMTESSAAISGGRIIVLAASGLEQAVWIDSRDSRVRTNHTIYGEAGAKPLGFNWAKLSDNGAVILRWPLDPECEDASEVANCRCFAAPADEEFEGSQEELNLLLGDLGEDEE